MTANFWLPLAADNWNPHRASLPSPWLRHVPTNGSTVKLGKKVRADRDA
jgi:hypothetical protein